MASIATRSKDAKGETRISSKPWDESKVRYSSAITTENFQKLLGKLENIQKSWYQVDVFSEKNCSPSPRFRDATFTTPIDDPPWWFCTRGPLSLWSVHTSECMLREKKQRKTKCFNKFSTICIFCWISLVFLACRLVLVLLLFKTLLQDIHPKHPGKTPPLVKHQASIIQLCPCQLGSFWGVRSLW